MLTEMPDADDGDAQRHSPDHEGTKATKATKDKHEENPKIFFV
jgi:hypothetical protein